MTDDPRPGFNALRDKMLQHLEVHRAAKLEDLAQAAATFAYEALYFPGSSDVPHVQRTAPRRIYLCVSDDLDDRDEPFSEVREEVTWARDEATRVAVPYVRADLVNAGTAVADERAAFEAAILAMPGGEPSLLRRRDAPGSSRPSEYVDHTIQVGWMCWQAGRAALAAPKAEAPEWASCETRGPVFRGWLREAAIHLRGREKSVRAAYAKDYMRVPCEYVAEAYAEAAAAIERRLALLAPPAHQGATHHE